MMRKRKKILVIYCGALHGVKPEDVRRWFLDMSEISIIADCEMEIFYSDNTANIKPKDWLSLAAFIYKHYDQYDGFVVLHGLENILYTSSALSFLLQNLSKPVIFTVEHLTEDIRKKSFFGSSKEVGVKANLINAVQAATFPIHEVALMFGNKIFRANAARRTGGAGLNVFDAPQSGILGRIDFSIKIFEKNLLQSKGSLKIFWELEEKVCVFFVHPAIHTSELFEQLSGYKGIIFDFGDLGVIPDEAENLILKLAKKIAVLVRMNKETDFVMPKHIISASSMTSKTALVKLMWAFKQTKNLKVLKEIMEYNVAGEVLL